METHAFGSLLDQLSQPTARQYAQLQARLGQGDAGRQVGSLLDQAAQAKLSCPRCAGRDWYRHGRESGVQRYRCRACGKTFNSLTGTPLARLHYKERWLRCLDGMLASHTVRQAAATLGVHRNTTFRWRHRFLALPRTDRAPLLHGIAEADEMFLLESQKGARHLERPPRRRGGHARRRYLPNYLGWRCILDAHRIDTPESLLKAAIGCFPRFAVA